MISQFALLAPVRTYPFHQANLAPLEAAWQQYRNDPVSVKFVRKVGNAMDSEVFLHGESSLRVYEPIFGYGIPPERFRTTLESGQTTGQFDFNIHHPQAFVAPSLVGVQPYSKIPAADGARAVAFLSRRQPDWPQPLIIRSFAAISLVALAVTLTLLMMPLRNMGRL